jgi:D-alanyl-D-alanine carboxypeptidase (penicillin-binding protein 5/6)
VRAVLSAFLIFALAPLAHAQTFETEATHAVIYDVETETVLWSHNGEEPMPPASMSKLMTVLMAFEAIDEGRLSLDDELPVSEEAWRRGGSASGSSTMFLDVNSRVRVDDLLRGIIVQSGNDACIVIAEALGGTEANFAAMMTDRAHELGLTSASFANSTGWPDPQQRISALDLARLGAIIIEEHPELYEIYAEREYTYNGIRQFNRNPLLGVFDGADGLKTGHTEESGYGLVGSAVRDGERRIIVFNGMGSERARANEAERLMRAAFAEFAVYDLFEAGDEVGQAEIFMGRSGDVALVTQEDISVGLSRAARRDMQVAIVYDGPVPAPVAEGDVVAHLVVEAPGYDAQRFPLVAAETVDRKGMFGRAADAVVHLIRG